MGAAAGLALAAAPDGWSAEIEENMDDDEVLTDAPMHVRLMVALEELSGAIIICASLIAMGVLAQAWMRGNQIP